MKIGRGVVGWIRGAGLLLGAAAGIVTLLGALTDFDRLAMAAIFAAIGWVLVACLLYVLDIREQQIAEIKDALEEVERERKDERRRADRLGRTLDKSYSVTKDVIALRREPGRERQGD